MKRAEFDKKWNNTDNCKDINITSVVDTLQGLNNLDSDINPILKDFEIIGAAYPVQVNAVDNLLNSSNTE